MDAIGALQDVAGDFRAAGGDDLAQATERLIRQTEQELSWLEIQQAEELRGLEDACRE